MTDPGPHEERRILVVDDEPSIRRLVTLFLQEEGYTTVGLGSGFEAIAYVQEHRPALILLDLMMPDIDGEETLRQIRALPNGADIPVILMTAAIALANRIQDTQGILGKPFDLSDLLCTVDRLVRSQGTEWAPNVVTRGR